MSQDLTDDLNQKTEQMFSGPTDMVEMLNYTIWGSVVTTTRAFGLVKLKVDTNANRIYVAIKLRWWADVMRFEKLHRAWLIRAEDRCKKHIPDGWRVVVYYDRSL